MAQNRTLKGVAVSGGLAVGPVHIVRAVVGEVPTWFVREDEVPLEIGRLAAALTAVAELLREQESRVAREAGPNDAAIFAVHRMILEDPNALRDVEKTIRDTRVNAEAAIQQLIERMGRQLGRLEGNSVRDFAADVADPWKRVLDMLLHRDREEVGASQGRVVLAASELTPQVVTYLPRERILAVVCERGGRFSHGAVLARSLGLPCVVGLTNLLGRLEQGVQVAVDGGHGAVILRPGDDDLARFGEEERLRRMRIEAVRGFGAREARTSCGARFVAQVNVESLLDLDTFEVAHTDGIGLLRTEFLYMERTQFPSEEEQYRLYRRVLEHMDGKPVTMRTLDIGGDKPLPYFKTPLERNPALGWRGLRISLQWTDLLRVQLSALLRASVHGDLRILLPMVGTLEQIEEARQVFDRVRANLVEQGYDVAADVPVGVMVEVPSLLFCLPEVLARVDFVSVGTNDLVQYLLAVDRDNAQVVGLYEPLQPSVLAALHTVVQAARAAGKPCSVCGDIAGDPVIAVLLAGLGFDGVSVAPHFLSEIKFALSGTTLQEAREFADGARKLAFGREVRDWLARRRRKLYEDLLADPTSRTAGTAASHGRESGQGHSESGRMGP
jgi:phosphoenolpyruvate-protein phosphotransferase (PTS system enzyme I)